MQLVSVNCNLANIYLFNVNNTDTRKMCEIRSKLTITIPERRRSGAFIVNFEHILQLTLNIFNTFF